MRNLITRAKLVPASYCLAVCMAMGIVNTASAQVHTYQMNISLNRDRQEYWWKAYGPHSPGFKVISVKWYPSNEIRVSTGAYVANGKAILWARFRGSPFGRARFAGKLVWKEAPVRQNANNRGQPIYLRNKTNSTIHVALRYKAKGANGFTSRGFWKVRPGQKLGPVVYNGNQWIYFYAEGGGRRWQGSALTTRVRGRTLRMFKENTGTGWGAWTMNFSR